MQGKTSFISVIRLLFSLGILILLALLYWSYLLQEEKLALIETELVELRKEQVQEQKIQKAHHVSKREVGNPKYPNLLVVDHYFTKTLPLLLGKDFTAKGVLRMATIANPENLHPFSNWADVSEWQGYCQGAVAARKFGYNELLSPDLAVKIEKRPTDRSDRTSFWIHLRDDIFWQPLEARHFPDDVTLSPHFLRKHPVTAHDFKFFFDALSNPHVDVPTAVALRYLMRDIERVDVVDDQTFAVIVKKTAKTNAKGETEYLLPYAARFQVAQLRPLASFVYQYGIDGKKICENDAGIDFYRTSTLWAEHFANHFASRVIVSCGPWIFDGMTNHEIRFRKNPDFYTPYRALYEAIEIYFLESPSSIFRDFVAQKIDLCEIPSQNLVELTRYVKSEEYAQKKQKGVEVQRLDYLLMAYNYVGWNQKNPLFQSKKVRQALDLAIDRKRLIRQNMNGQAVSVTGPFYINSTEYNPEVSDPLYDPEQAKRLLAEEGWFDSNGDGILDKKVGSKLVSFRFRLTYFVKNPISKANCEMIATFLGDIGIDCVTNGLDIADLSNEIEDKSFDALYLAWGHTLPPDDPRQLWHSEGADIKGSSNIIGFRNHTADLLIDELQFEHDEARRKTLYWQLHAVLHEEAPYSFLFTPKMALVSWNWIHNIFIPKERQDILPGAVWDQPSIMYSWKS